MHDSVQGIAVERAEPPSVDSVSQARAPEEIVSPGALRTELPRSSALAARIGQARETICRMVHGHDRRMLVVVGPCSVHDTAAALEYAHWLRPLRDRYSDDLEIVMRAYVEKPRTRVGWKGLVNDPFLDGSHRIGDGLRLARRMLLDINAMGVPTATEFVSLPTPAWLGDLVSWSAIGARSVESQPHRVMASGLDCAVGFKNGTSGSVEVAMDAMQASATGHHWMSVSESGRVAVVESGGNPNGHLVLRGGVRSNHDVASVRDAVSLLDQRGLPTRLMIDCGHANGAFSRRGQVAVAEDVVEMVARGERGLLGVMLESNLLAGRQAFAPREDLVFGQSITDACMGLDDTERLLEELARARHRDRAASPGVTAASI